MTSTSTEPAVEASFAQVARRLEAAHTDLERGRIMHSEGVKTRGKFCAFVLKGELVLKLPAERVGALIAAGQGRRSTPERGGR
jgi:hypothetical protein